jgi:hypothetical protein
VVQSTEKLYLLLKSFDFLRGNQYCH